jgi:hypothetical protein
MALAEARAMMVRLLYLFAITWILSCALGCRSPYYSDRGALAGGLAGAGVGAAIGDASGNAGPGAIIGAALGTITGNAIGESIDADLARSKAEIEARMGRQMSGAVTSQDVIAMTQAGLSEDVIATHVRANGVVQPPGVNDLIFLRNNGVSDRVIQALQQAPPPASVAQASYAAPVAYGPAPRTVVVEHYYAPPWARCAPCGPPVHWHHHGHRQRPGVRWGFSFAN